MTDQSVVVVGGTSYRPEHGGGVCRGWGTSDRPEHGGDGNK